MILIKLFNLCEPVSSYAKLECESIICGLLVEINTEGIPTKCLTWWLAQRSHRALWAPQSYGARVVSSASLHSFLLRNVFDRLSFLKWKHKCTFFLFWNLTGSSKNLTTCQFSKSHNVIDSFAFLGFPVHCYLPLAQFLAAFTWLWWPCARSRKATLAWGGGDTAVCCFASSVESWAVCCSPQLSLLFSF